MKGFYALLITLLLTSGLHASYEQYCNPRFNFCVDIDTRWGKEPSPSNNDGRSFFDGSGFKMSVWGSYNALNESLRQSMQNAKNDFDSVTYEAIRGNWYVLSGYKEANIVYIKVFLQNDTFYTLLMSYPRHEKDIYNPITARLSQSFKVAR